MAEAPNLSMPIFLGAFVGESIVVELDDSKEVPGILENIDRSMK